MYGEPWIADESPMEEGFTPSLKKHVDLLDDNIDLIEAE